ncbi:heptaprenyl diphosphate synthase component 1 [Paenibacillus sp. IHBB 10380]|uniref:heptaprenyl diphosphate synthase component 1 n=1 Tax=Paenibacillus sp. IHBB 10380 TaxID=1566358 RepID=UPI0005CFDF63|nr:heptaprenyl diphosphate synthase component 1 [Paenibacillus sp. IHBB 10380]
MKPYRIPLLAKNYIEYDMIQKHTELPSFPDARVHLLYIFLNRGGRTPLHHEELYALVTYLVQMGLDTHETIDTVQGNQAEGQMRCRQLKVLAGDYFSSGFYQLLSDQGQIEVIRLISQAICDVNIQKMNLYSKMSSSMLSAEQYLRLKVQLNMQLFLSFTPMLEKSVQDLWQQLLQEFSLCDTIVQELNVNKGPQRLTPGYPFISDEELTDKLHHTMSRIQSILQVNNGEVRFRTVVQLLEPFQSYLDVSKTVVREG